MRRFLVLTLTAALLCAGTEAQSLQATLDMNGVHAYFKFTPLGPGIPGARVKVAGEIRAQAVKPNVGFEYHIHEKPVGPNNDCMATGGHLDPAKFSDGHCNPATPDKCQEGDLSGKHGNLKPSAVPLGAITYVDEQLRWEGAATTIVGRSVVVHNNGTRIACADLLPIGPDAVNSAAEGEDDDVERHMVQSDERDGYARAVSLTARRNGAISGLEGSITMWTLATSVAAGVVAALMAL
ncbi:hypothetical protein BGZ59_006824 [Podila verticillata]|nr:hypothetical protein BGZ59_006824 [Podila verticillata]KFH69665.1 hypothetical protein MVEG_04471 [Podila verticillata NRRL 6337]